MERDSQQGHICLQMKQEKEKGKETDQRTEPGEGVWAEPVPVSVKRLTSTTGHQGRAVLQDQPYPFILRQNLGLRREATWQVEGPEGRRAQPRSSRWKLQCGIWAE